MNSQENLFETFRADEIDAADLSQLALSQFHSANDISPTEVLFGVGADNESYALKFIYKKQRLTQILAGSSLTTEDIVTARDFPQHSERFFPD
jgi:hypothetical protein